MLSKLIIALTASAALAGGGIAGYTMMTGSCPLAGTCDTPAAAVSTDVVNAKPPCCPGDEAHAKAKESDSVESLISAEVAATAAACDSVKAQMTIANSDDSCATGVCPMAAAGAKAAGCEVMQTVSAEGCEAVKDCAVVQTVAAEGCETAAGCEVMQTVAAEGCETAAGCGVMQTVAADGCEGVKDCAVVQTVAAEGCETAAGCAVVQTVAADGCDSVKDCATAETCAVPATQCPVKMAAAAVTADR